ncbi:uncharacterized protein BP01DRAFT_190966 [Aspergillus saccharolyticus JOP 1030-1]|uniref:Uncharacterized protein n=1 Tax=Aspergillus saccharolyticus JOP 1030-1 TaxID=1450539 RepID=A0A318ZKX5_9EURO|nr:hypothetical protein BP01DRAFT_190966 [Aspergillus saccharolyticus JOP 1030-1]PYH40888.1 hypothetical protein BP01DRAFT_190966 [Aspergillus saccharolyticus JOP 1030-1]
MRYLPTVRRADGSYVVAMPSSVLLCFILFSRCARASFSFLVFVYFLSFMIFVYLIFPFPKFFYFPLSETVNGIIIRLDIIIAILPSPRLPDPTKLNKELALETELVQFWFSTSSASTPSFFLSSSCYLYPTILSSRVPLVYPVLFFFFPLFLSSPPSPPPFVLSLLFLIRFLHDQRAIGATYTSGCQPFTLLYSL